MLEYKKWTICCIRFTLSDTFLVQEELMNSQRRNRLIVTKRRLNDIRSELDGIKDDLITIGDEEDEARGNMPENLESSERYEKSEECSEAICEAIDSVEDAVDAVASSIESLQNAI